MANIEEVKEQLQTKKTQLQTIEDSLKASAANMGQALPEHMKPERVNRIVLSMLKMSPKLQECTPISIIAAVFQMAQLGLEPIDGQAYIIPYLNKKKVGDRWTSQMEAQFQIGYKGYVTLFYRHMSSCSLDWGIVCENDTFDFDKGKGSLSHRINYRKERGAAYAYWVKAKLTNGAEIIEAMSKIEIEKFAKRYSRAYESGPWATDFDSMALKTVLRRLMKLLPKSIEIQKALDMDETTKTRVEPDMTQVADETTWEPIEAPEETKALPDAGKTADPAKPEDKKKAEDPKKPEEPKDDLDMGAPAPGQLTLDSKDTITRPDGVVINKKTGKPI